LQSEVGTGAPHAGFEIITLPPDLLIVYNNFDGVPDAVRIGLEAVIGECLLLLTIGRLNWCCSVANTDLSEKEDRSDIDKL